MARAARHNKDMDRFDGGRVRRADGTVIEAFLTSWASDGLTSYRNPEFVRWLDEVKSFTYDGADISAFTARKETKLRGSEYWSAYAYIGGKTVKRYIGKSDEIDHMKIMSTALKFVGLRQAAKGGG